jgi:hypothetical protein
MNSSNPISINEYRNDYKRNILYEDGLEKQCMYNVHQIKTYYHTIPQYFDVIKNFQLIFSNIELENYEYYKYVREIRLYVGKHCICEIDGLQLYINYKLTGNINIPFPEIHQYLLHSKVKIELTYCPTIMFVKRINNNYLSFIAENKIKINNMLDNVLIHDISNIISDQLYSDKINTNIKYALQADTIYYPPPRNINITTKFRQFNYVLYYTKNEKNEKVYSIYYKNVKKIIFVYYDDNFNFIDNLISYRLAESMNKNDLKNNKYENINNINIIHLYEPISTLYLKVKNESLTSIIYCESENELLYEMVV